MLAGVVRHLGGQDVAPLHGAVLLAALAPPHLVVVALGLQLLVALPPPIAERAGRVAHALCADERHARVHLRAGVHVRPTASSLTCWHIAISWGESSNKNSIRKGQIKQEWCARLWDALTQVDGEIAAAELARCLVYHKHTNASRCYCYSDPRMNPVELVQSFSAVC